MTASPSTPDAASWKTWPTASKPARRPTSTRASPHWNGCSPHNPQPAIRDVRPQVHHPMTSTGHGLGGATEGLGQLAAMLSGSDGEVILVTGDFPSVTYPWLAARDRSGMRIRWVRDVAAEDLTLSLVDAINEQTTVVCVSAVQFATGTLVDVAALV